MSNDRYNLVMRALGWLIYSARPLKVDALALGAVINPGKHFEEEERLDSDALILDYCGSFVTFHRQSNTVEISHFSVTQYLTSPILSDGTRNTYYLPELETHVSLLGSRFTWLKSPPFTTGSNRRIDEIAQRCAPDFSLYAVYEWPVHAQKVDNTREGSKAIVDFLGSEYFVDWAELWELYDSVPNPQQRWWEDTNFRTRIHTKKATPGGLYYSALFGLARTATRLLRAGCDPNETGGIHNFPLMAAVASGNEYIIELLLRKGADINVRGLLGGSLLHYALGSRSDDLTRRLLKQGAKTDVADDIQGSPLHLALEMRDIDLGLIRKLIGDRNINELPVREDDGATPLHIAARNGNLEAARMLINAGADVNAMDFKDQTPLHASVIKGFIKLVKLLLDSGADSRQPDYPGYTPMHRALENGHVEILKLLAGITEGIDETLEQGSPINLESGIQLELQATAKSQIRELAKRYSDDHILQHLAGRSDLGSTSESISEAANSASIVISKVVACDTRGSNTLEDIEHIQACSNCHNSSAFVPRDVHVESDKPEYLQHSNVSIRSETSLVKMQPAVCASAGQNSRSQK